MSEADEDRIIADTRRRLRWRAVLNILVSCAVLATEFTLGLGFHMISRPLRWQPIVLVSAIALMVGAVGMTGAWWVTRLPPEALTQRIALRTSEQSQRFLSRIYLLFPVVFGVLGAVASLLVVQVLNYGWALPDLLGGATVLIASAGYLLVFTGWGAAKRGRLIYDEELFLSFRTRGYIAGFWTVMAGLLLILALGLARPAWAVEALPILMAVGVCVPAMTVALLNRQAERDV